MDEYVSSTADRVLGLGVQATAIAGHPAGHGEQLPQGRRLLIIGHHRRVLGQQLGQGLVEAQLALVDGDADQDAQHALGHRPDVPVIGGLVALVEGQLGRAVDADQDERTSFTVSGPAASRRFSSVSSAT